MKRVHRMPFGAEWRPGEGAYFRLWAPTAKEVCLVLAQVDIAPLAMTASNDGWFELLSQSAVPGSRYKFQIDRDLEVPDPASRFQPSDVHGPSEVIDPVAFEWQDEDWHGRPWSEVVLYELHVGTFSPAGTFAAVEGKLDYLVDLGVTALELMPVSDFPGARNWGYDGVLPFAPDSQYGRPEDLKRLVQSAHSRGLMVFLDVVYNHFGPEGNYLRVYAPQFFTQRHRTPWGDAVNFDGPGSRVVRDFFIHNALYWLTEYHFDGLRLDAVHAIADESSPDILTELAQRARSEIGPARQVHLVLENDNNIAHYLKRDRDRLPVLYNAQWNDDIHHALHVAITGEADGYYADYACRPVQYLGRCLAEGFAYQGQASEYRGGERRGEPSRDLPPTAFVSFLQNHDQVGNRPFGDRIVKLAEPQALRAAMTIFLLAPSPPLLFMGEEFGAQTPFLFFCNFGPDLAAAVTEGRRNEFSRFARFSDPAARARIPDPNAETTFVASKLDWNSLGDGQQSQWLRFYRDSLRVRRQSICPLIPEIQMGVTRVETWGEHALSVSWNLIQGRELRLVANLGPTPVAIQAPPAGDLLYGTGNLLLEEMRESRLPALSAAWFVTR